MNNIGRFICMRRNTQNQTPPSKGSPRRCQEKSFHDNNRNPAKYVCFTCELLGRNTQTIKLNDLNNFEFFLSLVFSNVCLFFEIRTKTPILNFKFISSMPF